MRLFRQEQSDDARVVMIARLEAQIAAWRKLAEAARERDGGPSAELRECRVYPDGFWSGTAYGLDVAARELNAILTELKTE